jgi:DNA-binding XRE family transcriptional regulator
MSNAAAVEIQPEVPRGRPADLVCIDDVRGERAERLLQRLRQLGAVEAKEFFAERPGNRSPDARSAVRRFVGSAVAEGTVTGLAGVRTLAGLTQLELARTLGVAQSQIARWERPDHFEGITVANLRRLAQALDADVRDFFRIE